MFKFLKLLFQTLDIWRYIVIINSKFTIYRNEQKERYRKICLVNGLLMNIKVLAREAGLLPGFVGKERAMVLVMDTAHSNMDLTSLGCAGGVARSAMVVRVPVSLGVVTSNLPC